MKPKSFGAITIRPVANGVIVEPDSGHRDYASSMVETHVFTTLDDLFTHLMGAIEGEKDVDVKMTVTDTGIPPYKINKIPDMGLDGIDPGEST